MTGKSSVDPESLLLEGILTLQQGERERAGAMLVRYTRLNPESASGWLWLSRCLEDPGEVDFCLRKARELDPELTASFGEEDVSLTENAEGTPGVPVSPGAQESRAAARLYGLITRFRLALLNPKVRLGALAGLLLVIIAAGVGWWAYSRNLEQEKSKLGPQIEQARAKLQNCGDNCDFQAALELLDPVLRVDPDRDEGRFLRAFTHLRLAERQADRDVALKNLDQALADIDRAVRTGTPEGEEYLLRYRTYQAMADRQAYRVDAETLQAIGLENLQTAVQLGINEPEILQEVPELLFVLGRCDEGFAALQVLMDEQPPDMPVPNLSRLMALGILRCEGNAEEALAYLQDAIDLFPGEDFRYERALLLYYQGQYAEAQAELNQLIDEHPVESGQRYFLRALIQYELGNYRQADDDLAAGLAFSTQPVSLFDYIQSLIRLDNGDPEESVRLLQQAEANTRHGVYTPMIERCRQELTDLGAAPLEPEVTVKIKATPITVYSK